MAGTVEVVYDKIRTTETVGARLQCDAGIGQKQLDIDRNALEFAIGKDSFAADPPNANLSIVGGAGIRNSVVELKNPRYDGTNLSYEIKVTDGDLPSSGGTTALFIDGRFSGGAMLSGARSAGLGALGGAIAGNAGAGAAIGAAGDPVFTLERKSSSCRDSPHPGDATTIAP